MPREDLTLTLNTGPQDFSSATTPQLNTPSSFNSGNLFEQLQGFKNIAIVGAVGLTGKRIFDSFVGGVGQRTGRNDLQRKINRVRKGVGIATELGIGAALGPVGFAVASVKVGSDLFIDAYERNVQFNIDGREAEYRRLQRGNRINESRSRV